MRRHVVKLQLALLLSACGSDAGSKGPSAQAGAPAAGSGTLASAGSAPGPAGSGAAGAAGARASGAAGSQPSGAAGGSSAAGAGAGGQPAGGAGGSGAAGSGARAAGGGAAGMAPVGPAPQAGNGALPAASGCNGDPLEVLRGLAPSDEDTRKDYMSYLSDELGSVTCATQGSGSRTITQPIFVPRGAVYDGKGERLTADAAAMRCDTSEGEQAENQRPYFVLAPGAGVKNVTISYPGCEGIHMLGDNTLDDITWEDAGEDAASVRSYFPGGKITIRDSEGHKAADKMFQFNAPCSVRIENFRGSDMGKLVRQNGGTEFKLEIDLNTVDVSGVISAVVQSDSPQCFVRYHDLKYQFTGSGDKADRVFRDIPPGNVMQY